MKKMIPNLRGLEEYEAKERLEKEGFKYENEVEKSFSFLRRGKIVKTNPKKDSEIDTNQKVTLYVSRGPLLFILVFMALMITGLSLTMSKGVFHSIVDQNIITGIKAPKIDTSKYTDKKGNPVWMEDTVIQIQDPDTKKKIEYYEYCINDKKGTKDCDWKSTTTNNIQVAENGHKYISVRAIDEDGNRGKIAEVEVFIDNNNPTITNLVVTNVTQNEISVKTEAIDNESGISAYYYSLDGKEWVKGDTTYTFKDLIPDTKYRVYVKVEDKIGNSIIVSVDAKTLKEGEKVKELEPVPTSTPVPTTTPEPTATPEPTTTPESTATPEPTATPEITPTQAPVPTGSPEPTATPTESPKPTTGPENTPVPTPTATPQPTPTVTPKPTATPKPEENWDIPQISLKDVPTKFTFGDKYDLPSSVDFGNDTGTYECLVDGKEYKDTSTLKVGTHFIVCTAISSHNKQAMVEKEIEVKMTTGEDEVLDGWIRLNLYYPDGSINRQWRLLRDGEVRTAEDGWEDYTGPILIKVDDVENVYIRYDLDGETYIVSPSGRVLVDIEPEHWTLNDGEKTKVIINYDKYATVKQYRINGGNWQDYTGEFEVDVKTLIDARVTKEEKIYNSAGEYLVTRKYSDTDTVYIDLKSSSQHNPGSSGSSGGSTETGGSSGSINPGGSIGGSVPSYPTDLEIAGPVITSNPSNEIVDSTTITITPQLEARTIYYQEDNGSWKKYTGSFKVNKNEWIKSYYITEEDGRKSQVSYYRVSNIKVGQVPYVALTATPSNYLTQSTSKVTVSINANNYDQGTLEYSLDGIIYEPYTNPIEIEESKSVYARARNSYGMGTDSLTITTLSSPKIYDKLDVYIDVSPNKDEVEGLVNKAKVTISYDSRATKKYYSFDNSNWIEYTGSFEITENKTIYAYATSENGRGSANIAVDYLTTGIIKPIINANTKNKAYQVKVSIDYDRTANVKQYKIGNGSWEIYTGPFYVYENTTIYASNKNELGYTAESYKVVNNVISRPEIITLDEGMYYLIKINYPDFSDPSSREYKWLENGEWKKYDSKGILLIKQEARNLVTQTASGIKVVDSKGKEVIVNDHYYFLDKPLYEAMDDIYARWDVVKPKKPEIILGTTDPTKEVEVGINYQNTLEVKQYKVSYEDGTDTGWKDYTGTFNVNTPNSIVYAKGVSAAGIETDESIYKITNIDNEAPVINIKGNLETPKQKVVLTPNVVDNMRVDKVKFLKGSHSVEDFVDEIAIPNRKALYIEENGIYTFYAVDVAGYEVVKEVEVTNVDKDAPNISIMVEGNSYIEAVATIDYGDSTLKQYKIANNKWQTYTGPITIKAEEVYSLANEDGSLTISAQGKDQAGNPTEVSEKIYILDLDMPQAPVINASAGYPILTEYGVKYDDILTVQYDDRDDIINYICLKECDNEENWKVYTGYEHVQSGTIKAKSVKKESGLTISVSTNISQPTDALGVAAYDENYSTSYNIYQSNRKIYVSEEMQGRIMLYSGYSDAYRGNCYLYFYDNGGNVLGNFKFSQGWKKTDYEITIPNGTSYIYFDAGREMGKINTYEIKPKIQPNIIVSPAYPTLTEYGVKLGCDNITIEYYSTSMKRLYQIVPAGSELKEDGWRNYNDTNIELATGSTIYAKGIDRNGVDTPVVNYTSALPTDALGVAAYDGNLSTSYNIYQSNRKIYVSEEMQGRIMLYSGYSDAYRGNCYLYFYDDGGNVLGNFKFSQGWKKTDAEITIPEGTLYIYFDAGREMGKINTYEIGVSNKPVINDIGNYPKLTSNGFADIKHTIKVNYLSYLVDREYSLDNGETWIPYTGEFATTVGTKVLARAKNQYGVYTQMASYEVKDATDVIGNTAIDNNHATIYTQASNTSKSFLIDESIVGSKVRIYLNSTPANNSIINMYDFAGELIGTSELTSPVTVFTVPDNIYKVTINSGSSSLQIKDIDIRPDLSVYNSNPIINLNNSVCSLTKDVTINYKNASVKEYSLDLGETWIEYTGTIHLDKVSTIIARGMDSNGKLIGSSSIIINKVACLEGDSFISAIRDNNLSDGVYTFGIADNKYTAHLYTFDGNQSWNDEKVFGDDNDVSTNANEYAKNMVIVKVNGDLTIGENGKVLPYSTKYGGPKGFMLYVTGKLINNGNIDNSYGAYALGENVYLWKNSDGSYEYIPAIGPDSVAGSARTTSSQYRFAGITGIDGSNRSTGGGGSGGATHGDNHSGYLQSGASGIATSYSGGTGGGAAGATGGGSNAAIAQGGQPNGGAGGYGAANSGTTSSSYAPHGDGGGAGNPGGAGATYQTKSSTKTSSQNGENGTGGLLIIYADSIINNGTITANGSNGGGATGGYTAGGGASGGGSINIFHHLGYANNNLVEAKGGTGGHATSNGGNGGNGTVTVTNISSGTSKKMLSSRKMAMAYIAPSISIDTVDLTTSKVISIKYQDGYKGEYSLDLGTTWLEYKEPIIVSENATVLARTVDNDDKVVMTSSFTITSVKQEEKNTTESENITDKDETDDKTGGEVINPNNEESEGNE